MLLCNSRSWGSVSTGTGSKEQVAGTPDGIMPSPSRLLPDDKRVQRSGRRAVECLVVHCHDSVAAEQALAARAHAVEGLVRAWRR